MRQTLSLLCLLFLMAELTAVVTEVASLRGFLYGTEDNCAYDNWVSHISEGQVSSLNIYAPWETQNNNFGDYRIPTTEELAQWDLVMADFLSLDLSAAQQKITQFGFPYDVVQFQDLDSGREIYMLREHLSGYYDDNGTEDSSADEIGSFDYGWGLYLFDPNASRPIVITAPHPCDDYPSPVFALEAFLSLDARFLLIAGAGREVAYFTPYNSNNQSISDPSREDAHAFNVAYQRCADQLRAITGETGFSLQIHSYDWNKYLGQPNVMLSAGNGRPTPNLPLRDSSRARHDLINSTPWLVHPANSLGTHSEVVIQDFYCVNYSGDPLTYDHDGETVNIANNIELPGALYNQQMLYTEQQNLYDVYSPFLHVEMDELPKCYDLTTDNWYWFYGYDSESQTWNVDQRYTRFLEFYQPWLDALDAVIDSMLVLDDGTGPSNPENLRPTYLQYSYLTLAWDRSYAYDFDSYLLILRWEQEGVEYQQTYDRSNNPSLAWQPREGITLELIAGQRVYYAKLCARDKHGNYSTYTNEVKIWNLGEPLEDLAVQTGSGWVGLSWTTQLTAFEGFNLLRATRGGSFQPLASWRDTPSLAANATGQYAFTDSLVVNGQIYDYQIGAEFSGGTDLYYWKIREASPNPVYHFVLNAPAQNQTKDFWLGANPLAEEGSDGFDAYAQASSGTLQIGTTMVSNSYIWYRDIRGAFDPGSSSKTWALRYRCNYHNATLVFSPDPALLAMGDDIFLYDRERNYWHDFRAGAYVWISPDDNGWHYLDLRWGKLPPTAIFPGTPDLISYVGTSHNFSWQIVNQARVNSVDLWLSDTADSLLVESGLPPQLTQWTYIPAEAVNGACLLVVLHLTDGSELLYRSSQRFTFVPAQISYQTPPGFSLLSFPCSGFPLPVDELLGASAAAYAFVGGSWQPRSTFLPSTAYLVNQTQASQLALDVVLPLSGFSVPLSPGWNLLANPLACEMELRDLTFTGPGLQSSFVALAEDNLLSPRILLLGADGFRPADALPPGQAGFLYYQGAANLTTFISPYTHATDSLPADEGWSVNLSLDDGFNSADAVQLGSSDASSPGFDFLSDLLKPPALPQAPYRLALLNFDPASGQTRELQTDLTGLYPWYNEAEKLWPFQFETADTRPLRFQLEASRLPENYSVELCVNGQVHPLTDQGLVWFDPPFAGLHAGWIRIRNFTPGQALQLSSASFKAWPNPFSAGINFSIPELKGSELHAAIYNLRGQKVRQLAEGKADLACSGLHWDGRDAQGRPVAPGLYFFRLESGGQVFTQKLLKQ